MSETSAPVTTETAPISTTPETQTPTTTTPQAPVAPVQGLGSPDKGFEFIPEQYRNASWATKYKSPDEFFKGIDGMAAVIGKKEIINIQGVQPPAADAPDEAWEAFHNQIGRPESSDKYALPADIQAYEGFDMEGEKKTFTELAYQSGLTQKQAEKLFKGYIAKVNENGTKADEARGVSFEQAIKTTFPENTEASLALAKRGAKALGIASKLDDEGLSLNPMVLQLCAKLGELAGEDSFVKPDALESKDSILEEAKRLQMSPEYKKGDKEVHRRVTEIYQRVYDK